MDATLTLMDLAGAIALLIWGVHMVQTGVTRAFGPQLRRILSNALGNRFKVFLAGLGVTSILQSSTATGLWQQGAWMDPDLNKYDLNNRVTHHPVMSDEDWDGAYRAAWESFYSLEHIYTILRRAAASARGRPHTTLTTLLWFKLMTMFEGVHPLEGGAFRRKSRRSRRHGLPLESPFEFYPRYFGEIADKAWGYWSVYRRARAILGEVLSAPDRWTYSDLAIALPPSDEFDRLDLYHATAGGEAAVARKRREDTLRARVG